MSDTRNEDYYHTAASQTPDRSAAFFRTLAKRLVDDIHPQTVLDAGCATGRLVAALRDLGVEAYGLQPSGAAADKLRKDIRPYCKQGSLTDPLPKGFPAKYDLVVTIDALGQLGSESGAKAIRRLCGLTDTILFCPPSASARANALQREQWAALFAKNSFFDDLLYRPTYIADHAICFRRQSDWLGQLETYERYIRQAETAPGSPKNAGIERDELIGTLQGQAEQLTASKRREKGYARQLEEAAQREKAVQEQLMASQAQAQAYMAERDQQAAMYQAIATSTWWKLTKPGRMIGTGIKRVINATRPGRLFYKGLRSLLKEGPVTAMRRVKAFLSRKLRGDAAPAAPAAPTAPTPEDLAGPEVTDQHIRFSILVPLYNTPAQFLKELIASVQAQTYANWELCLADGSDAQHADVEAVCREAAREDQRIVYQRLEKNEGIAINSNRCADMATGDYLALLDHDDLLVPAALATNALVIAQTQADVLYSDEDHLSTEGQHINPFYKPDWSPDLLYSQMYIGHLLVFRRDLFQRIGGFRDEFSGSQDYDLMLRLSEETDRICHIPHVLYNWRESPTSTAANADAKPYAHDAGKRALDGHLKRVYGSKAHAEDSRFTFVYDARFDLLTDQLISIIIPMKDKWELTEACIKSILEKTSYPHYEIILLDNRSEEKATLRWLKQAPRMDARIRVIRADMEFNWSKLNNFGIDHAKGDVFVFLNNDTLIISEDWLDRLGENALREDIGVVGAQLLYEDETIQHAGVVVGFGGWADHVFKGMQPVHYGCPFVSPEVSRNVLAVTGACMAVSRETIERIGRFDEEFIICGSDVELCVRAYENGLWNRYDANVMLYHLESKSRDSYIPEIDFKKSYECYTPYRENIDPFYNINLDLTSVVPKERVAPMNLTNVKNFLKRCPLTASAYVKLREAVLAAPPSVSIPEVQAILPRRTGVYHDELRLNLLIPSVDRKHVFGGIATAVRFLQELERECGCAIRIITLDAPVDPENTIDLDGYEIIDCDIDAPSPLQIVAFNDRASSTIPVGKQDVFIATGWWTAYCIAPVIRWQAETYQAAVKPFVYLIQDYEPGFYPWSSRYMMADSTYHLDVPTLAVMNSYELREYFEKNGYHFQQAWHFDPVLNDSLRKYLPPADKAIPKKKQILVYGRPSTARNAFELLVQALKEWCALQENPQEWTILSAGEEHPPIELVKDIQLKSVGKLSLPDYAQMLADTYAGVSLMVSPHPSYPPLEMATFGVRTITNRYANKDLSTFSKNIVSLRACSPLDIAKALHRVCDAYDGQGQTETESHYVKSDLPFGTIIPEISKALRQL